LAGLALVAGAGLAGLGLAEGTARDGADDAQLITGCP
jgi:hypothetical protein